MHLSHFINTSSLLSKCLGYPCMGWIKCEHFSFLLFISNIKVSGDFGKGATLFYFIFAWFLKNVINSMLKSKKAYPIEVSNPSQTVFWGVRENRGLVILESTKSNVLLCMWSNLHIQMLVMLLQWKGILSWLTQDPCHDCLGVFLHGGGKGSWAMSGVAFSCLRLEGVWVEWA